MAGGVQGEQRQRGETEEFIATLIVNADGDCGVALIQLARRFDMLMTLFDQLTDMTTALATAVNLHAAHGPRPPEPLKAAPYQHQSSRSEYQQ